MSPNSPKPPTTEGSTGPRRPPGASGAKVLKTLITTSLAVIAFGLLTWTCCGRLACSDTHFSLKLQDYLIEMAWINDRELLIVTASGDVAVAHVGETSVRRTVIGDGARFSNASLSARTGRVAIVDSDGVAFLLDTNSLETVFRSDDYGIANVMDAVAVDGSSLLIAQHPSVIALVSVDNGRVLSSVSVDGVYSSTLIQLSGDGESAIVCGPSSVHLLSIMQLQLKLVKKFQVAIGGPSVLLSDDGDLLLPTVGEKSYALISGRTGEFLARFTTSGVEDLKQNQVVIASDRASIAAAYLGGTDLFPKSVLAIWARAGQQELLRNEYAGVVSVTNVPGQPGFAVASDGQIQFMNGEGDVLRTLGSRRGINYMLFSPSGDNLAYNSTDGTSKQVVILSSDRAGGWTD